MENITVEVRLETEKKFEECLDTLKSPCTKQCCCNSICNFIWCCIPCTKVECCKIVRCKEISKHYLRALIYYVGVCAGLYAFYKIESYQKYWEFMDTDKTVALVSFVCSIYFFLAIIQNLFVSYPTLDQPIEEDVTDQAIAVIACHGSATEIGDTVGSLLKVLRPDQIHVADNGNSVIPIDNTADIVKGMGLPDENYHYFSVASKVNALYKTVEEAKDKERERETEQKEVEESIDGNQRFVYTNLFKAVQQARKINPTFNYVILIDDDTLVPHDFRIDKKCFDSDKVSAVAYGIKINNPQNLVEKLVDWEYKIYCWKNYWRSQWSTLKFAIGIFSVWRYDRFQQVYSLNPCHPPGLPFGEDGWAGFINRKLGYQMREDLRFSVASYAPPKMWPTCIIPENPDRQGYGAVNLWKQRAYRWYRNYPRRMLAEIILMICYDAGSLRGNIFYRLDILYGMFLFWSAITIPIAIIRVALSEESLWFWFALHSGLYGSGLLTNVVVNFFSMRKRPDIQVELIVLIFYPFFTLWVAFARFFGAVGSILYYIPWRSPHGTLI